MPVVLPGDVLSLPSSSSSSSSAIRLGPGLVYPSEAARASNATRLLVTRGGVVGKVDEKGKGKERRQGWWIEGPVGRYVPSAGDPVIGQITAKNADFYTVHLSSAHPATLPVLSFEGATKRHRPNLKIGACVYALVCSAEKWMEPEVTCVDLSTGKGNGMGELEGKEEGVNGIVEISLALAKSLLRPSHPLLPTLSTHFPLESAVGTNGQIWIRVSHPAHFLAAKLVLQAADRFGSRGVEEFKMDTSIDPVEQGFKGRKEEKRPGDWGRKLSAGWGRLGEKDVARIVTSVLGS